MVMTGEMDHRVAVQKYTQTRGAQGGFIESWATENTMWAKLNPIGAQERIDADQTQNVRTHRVTMNYYSPGITGKDRLLFTDPDAGTRIFNIVSVVNPGERGCFTILDVREAVVI